MFLSNIESIVGNIRNIRVDRAMLTLEPAPSLNLDNSSQEDTRHTLVRKANSRVQLDLLEELHNSQEYTKYNPPSLQDNMNQQGKHPNKSSSFEA